MAKSNRTLDRIAEIMVETLSETIGTSPFDFEPRPGYKSRLPYKAGRAIGNVGREVMKQAGEFATGRGEHAVRRVLKGVSRFMDKQRPMSGPARAPRPGVGPQGPVKDIPPK